MIWHDEIVGNFWSQTILKFINLTPSEEYLVTKRIGVHVVLSTCHMLDIVPLAFHLFKLVTTTFSIVRRAWQIWQFLMNRPLMITLFRSNLKIETFSNYVSVRCRFRQLWNTGTQLCETCTVIYIMIHAYDTLKKLWNLRAIYQDQKKGIRIDAVWEHEDDAFVDRLRQFVEIFSSFFDGLLKIDINSFQVSLVSPEIPFVLLINSASESRSFSFRKRSHGVSAVVLCPGSRVCCVRRGQHSQWQNQPCSSVSKICEREGIWRTRETMEVRQGCRGQPQSSSVAVRRPETLELCFPALCSTHHATVSENTIQNLVIFFIESLRLLAYVFTLFYESH